MSHYMFLSFIEAPRWAIMGLAVKIAQSVSNLQDQSEATYPYSISQPIPLLSTFLDRLTCVFRVFSYHASSKPIFFQIVTANDGNWSRMKLTNGVASCGSCIRTIRGRCVVVERW